MSTKKKAYIAGKITGLNLIEASQKFGRKQKELHEQGYETVVPLDIVPHKCSWQEAMKICIPAMLDCDEVHLLPCWQDSPGAKLERDIALRLKMPIVHH